MSWGIMSLSGENDAEVQKACSRVLGGAEAGGVITLLFCPHSYKDYFFSCLPTAAMKLERKMNMLFELVMLCYLL